MPTQRMSSALGIPLPERGIDSPGRVCISLPFQHMLSQCTLSPLAVCQWIKDATKHTVLRLNNSNKPPVCLVAANKGHADTKHWLGT